MASFQSDLTQHYSCYFSALYQEDLKDNIILLQTPQERNRFLLKYFLPVAAESYLSGLNLKDYDILLYCKASEQSDIFYAIEKITKTANRIHIMMQRIVTYVPDITVTPDCKCYVITLPKSITANTQRDRFLSTLFVTTMDKEITEDVHFLGTDFHPKEEKFGIDCSPTTHRANNLSALQAACRRNDYIDRCNLALTGIFGTFLGGICRAEVASFMPTRAYRLQSFP